MGYLNIQIKYSLCNMNEMQNILDMEEYPVNSDILEDSRK